MTSKIALSVTQLSTITDPKRSLPTESDEGITIGVGHSVPVPPREGSH